MYHPTSQCNFIWLWFIKIPGVKRLDRGLNTHLHLAARLKKKYSYTRTPLWVFMTSSRVSFTFTLALAFKHWENISLDAAPDGMKCLNR